MASIDANGNRIDYYYDVAGRLEGVELPEAYDGLMNESKRAQIHYEYDSAGYLTALVDDYGNRTEYEYDDARRVIGIQLPNGLTEHRAYEGLLLKSKTDAEGRIVTYSYNASGQITAIQLPHPDIQEKYFTAMRYTYDELGNRLSQIDALNRETSYTYDRLGHLTSVVLPDGSSSQYTYDVLGLLTAYTDFNGHTTTYSYDEMNRLTEKRPAVDPVVSINYNDAGLRWQVTNGEDITTYYYDDRDRLIRIDSPKGVINYAYDDNGNRTSVTAAGTATSYAYDALNRLINVSEGDSIETRYFYDALGRLVSQASPSGLETLYRYNTDGRLIMQDIVDQNDVIIASIDYVRSSAGRLMRVNDFNGDTVTFSYDQLGRLLTEKRNGEIPDNRIYQYDLVGNRVQETVNGVVTGYVYDNNDQLTAAGTKTFSHDSNGNLLKITDGAYNETFNYDDFNRLIGYQSDGQDYGFAYDDSGNRVFLSTPAGNTHYLVDPGGRGGLAKVLATFDDNDNIKQRYVQGLGPLSLYEGDQRLEYHSDAQRNVRLLTDETGKVTDSYTYAAYGPLVDKLGSNDNPLLFAGQRYDDGLRRYYMRARYYDQETGRFINRDPMSSHFSSRAVWHPYAYALNNPVSNWDPSGLWTLPELSVTNCVSNTLNAIKWVWSICQNKDIAKLAVEAYGLASLLTEASSSPLLSRSDMFNGGQSQFTFEKLSIALWKNPLPVAEGATGLQQLSISLIMKSDFYWWAEFAANSNISTGLGGTGAGYSSLGGKIEAPIYPWHCDYFIRKAQASIGLKHTIWKKNDPCTNLFTIAEISAAFEGSQGFPGSKAKIEMSGAFLGLMEVKQTVVEASSYDGFNWIPPFGEWISNEFSAWLAP